MYRYILLLLRVVGNIEKNINNNDVLDSKSNVVIIEESKKSV